MQNIPEAFHDLLQPETQAFAVLHTQADPSAPLLTVMWFSVDGDHILFNSVPTSRKHKNILANPKVQCLIFDPQNMYRYLSISGTVVEVTQAGANEHNQLLARGKYGWDDGTFGTNRVMYRVRVDHAKGIA